MKLFQKKPRIEVFVRYCHYSDISGHKMRLEGFDREVCFENLMDTADHKRVNFTFLLDTFHPTEKEHFVHLQTTYPVIEIQEGTETGSFLKLLSLVEEKDFSSDTLVYFLEDDYLHRDQWGDVLLEGAEIEEADYLTLFDHRDKYEAEDYTDLTAKLYYTSRCHWRTTPSTTNTYAMKAGVLKRDMQTHRAFSEGRRISDDHGKFLALGKEGKTLISSLPGYSTHVETPYVSPCYDWKKYFEKIPQRV